MRILILGIIAVIAFGLVVVTMRQPETTPEPTPTPTTLETATPTATPTPTSTPKPLVVTPTTEFKSRITKKGYALYSTPATSLVPNDHFTGYHTGVDVEFTDTTADIPVFAIANGTVVSARRATGYGGVIVIKHVIGDRTLYAIYGHIRLSTAVKEKATVAQGDQIGVLGTGESSETDGERHHLHFGIATKNTITGYVGDLATLQASWIDPLSLYP